MARKHYHVMTGAVGCTPDEHEVFDTRRDAEAFAREEAAAYRDAGVKVSGSARAGIYAIDPINYLEIVACTDSDCFDDNYAACDP